MATQLLHMAHSSSSFIAIATATTTATATITTILLLLLLLDVPGRPPKLLNQSIQPTEGGMMGQDNSRYIHLASTTTTTCGGSCSPLALGCHDIDNIFSSDIMGIAKSMVNCNEDPVSSNHSRLSCWASDASLNDDDDVDSLPLPAIILEVEDFRGESLLRKATQPPQPTGAAQS